jgi:hypothetical protein
MSEGQSSQDVVRVAMVIAGAAGAGLRVLLRSYTELAIKKLIQGLWFLIPIFQLTPAVDLLLSLPQGLLFKVSSG